MFTRDFIDKILENQNVKAVFTDYPYEAGQLGVLRIVCYAKDLQDLKECFYGITPVNIEIDYVVIENIKRIKPKTFLGFTRVNKSTRYFIDTKGGVDD